MKAVQWLVNVVQSCIAPNYIPKKIIDQAKEMEKQQQGYSEEEVLKFTQTMLMQYKFGNTDIEQMELLKETLELFKKKKDYDTTRKSKYTLQ